MGACGCERDGVKGREIRNDSQGAEGREVPFPVMGSTGGEAWGEDGNCVEGSGELPELGLGESEGHGHLDGG